MVSEELQSFWNIWKLIWSKFKYYIEYSACSYEDMDS